VHRARYENLFFEQFRYIVYYTILMFRKNRRMKESRFITASNVWFLKNNRNFYCPSWIILKYVPIDPNLALVTKKREQFADFWKIFLSTRIALRAEILRQKTSFGMFIMYNIIYGGRVSGIMYHVTMPVSILLYTVIIWLYNESRNNWYTSICV